MDFYELKVTAVRRYLRRHFQALELYDFEQADHTARVFRAYHPQSRLDYSTVVSREFLADHTPEEILTLLEQWQVADAMRSADRAEVIVTNHGAKIKGT